MSCIYPRCMMGGGGCDLEQKCVEEEHEVERLRILKTELKWQSEIDKLETEIARLRTVLKGVKECGDKCTCCYCNAVIRIALAK